MSYSILLNTTHHYSNILKYTHECSTIWVCTNRAYRVFWSMLEAGVSLLAVNLPSLWAYRTHFPSPDSLIASIRSVISLRTFGSDHSRGSNSNTRGMHPLSGDVQSQNSTSSKSQFVERFPGQNSETYAMYDVEGQKDASPPEGIIMVNSSVVQKENNRDSF